MERGQLLTPAQQWLALLRKLEREKGNAITATLEAKRQRPDLYAAWIGQKAASTQMELFTTAAATKRTGRIRKRVRGQQ